MNILEELAEHLAFCGFGSTATAEEDGDICWGRMPDEPDDCTCIFSSDTGTGGPDSPGRFQIMTRARSTRKAYELSCAIGEELDGFHGFLHGDGRQTIIEVVNAGTGMGADTKKREVYVTNIRVKYCN